MFIILRRGATPAQAGIVADAVRERGLVPHTLEGGRWTAVAVTGAEGPLDPAPFLRLDGVREVLQASPPWMLSSGNPGKGGRTFRVRDVEIGRDRFVLAAGPCAVESRDQVLEAARAVRESGARLLRGGIFKPRTSPYTFQGLGWEGLAALAEAREETGLAVVTECLDPRDVEAVAEVADVVQVGARNMQNFALLREVAGAGKPVLLKRGPGATLEEWLCAADHVLGAGEERVILCERGIRTFSRHSRYTLDLSVVPRLKEETDLPVWVDPSHSTGRASSVAAMGCAALAAGADGLLVEVHPEPGRALSDGPQSLTPAEFQDLAGSLRALAGALGRALA